ncbi:MAG: M20/M25/M40 family metallo-hydrolase [Candidatus Gracilibacteria bacterium]
MTKTVLEIAKKLISLNSENPPANNSACAQYIFDFLKELGLKPIKQPVTNKLFNIIVVGKGPILIQGHLDTVPFGDIKKWKYSPTGQIVKDKFFGRGIADMKGNVACFLSALQKSPTDQLSMAFTAIEETSFIAIEKAMELKKTLFKHVKYSITIEPTDGKLITCNKGQFWFEVTAKGKTAHSSAPEKGINAIEKLIEIIPQIKKYEKKINGMRHPLLGKATLSIGEIKGGTAPNIVPDHASIVIDRRVLTSENPKQAIKEMEKICAPNKVKLLKQIDPAETPKSSKIVKFMQKILASQKIDSKIYGYPATAELSEIRKHRIEGVIFGTSMLSQAHQENEYMTLKELEIGEKIYSKLIQSASKF